MKPEPLRSHSAWLRRKSRAQHGSRSGHPRALAQAMPAAHAMSQDPKVLVHEQGPHWAGRWRDDTGPWQLPGTSPSATHPLLTTASGDWKPGLGQHLSATWGR